MEDEFPVARLPVVQSSYTLNENVVFSNQSEFENSRIPDFQRDVQQRVVTACGTDIQAFVCVDDEMEPEPTIYYIPKSTTMNFGGDTVNTSVEQLSTPHRYSRNKKGHIMTNQSGAGKSFEPWTGTEEKKIRYETEAAKLKFELQKAKLNLLKVESELRKKEMDKKDREIILLNRQMSKIDLEILLMKKRQMFKQVNS